MAGFIDDFLQAGMRNLPTYLKETNHLLQIIDEYNEKIERVEFSLSRPQSYFFDQGESENTTALAEVEILYFIFRMVDMPTVGGKKKKRLIFLEPPSKYLVSMKTIVEPSCLILVPY